MFVDTISRYFRSDTEHNVVTKMHSGGFEKRVRAISQLRPHNYALSIFTEWRWWSNMAYSLSFFDVYRHAIQWTRGLFFFSFPLSLYLSERARFWLDSSNNRWSKERVQKGERIAPIRKNGIYESEQGRLVLSEAFGCKRFVSIDRTPLFVFWIADHPISCQLVNWLIKKKNFQETSWWSWGHVCSCNYRSCIMVTSPERETSLWLQI